MRRIVTSAVLALAAVLLAVPSALGDDPGPTVILGPPPSVGADAMIRAAGSPSYVGRDAFDSSQQIQQDIRQFQRAVSYVRVCSDNVTGRMRVRGAAGGVSFRVRYSVHRHDVTHRVVTGAYRTRSLRDGECAPRIRVVVRLKAGATRRERIFRVRAVSPSHGSDVVSTDVHVVGTLAVP